MRTFVNCVICTTILFLSFIFLGCGSNKIKINTVLIQQNIHEYLDTAKMDLSIDTVSFDSKSGRLSVIFDNPTDRSTLINDPQMLLNFSRYAFSNFLYPHLSDKVSFTEFRYKAGSNKQSIIEFPQKSFNEIKDLYLNKCYGQSMQFLFGRLYPELIQELENRFINVQIFLKIPPEKNFFDNLQEISGLNCNHSNNLEQMPVFRMVMLCDFYNYQEDNKMVYVVLEILKFSNIDLMAVNMDNFHSKMNTIVDSLDLMKQFDSDTSLVRQRQELIDFSKNRPYRKSE